GDPVRCIDQVLMISTRAETKSRPLSFLAVGFDCKVPRRPRSDALYGTSQDISGVIEPQALEAVRFLV
ncbi:MAG: hypothetical protein WBB38_10410, partial [Hyphomicrobiaceae bacterium]